MSAGKVAAIGLVLLAGAGAAWFVFVRPGTTSSSEEAPDLNASAAARLGAAEREPVAGARPFGEEEAGATDGEEPTDAVDGEWTRRNKDAIAALRAGDLDQAVEGFEACVAAVPEEPVFRRNLAEALARLARARYADGELAEAIALLERALELHPDRRDLAQRLERWRSVADTEEAFWKEESTHFEYAYDGARSQILHEAHVLIEELERAYLDLGELFNHFPVEGGGNKIRVRLYRKQEFDDVTGLGHWAGGVFDGTVRVPVEDLTRDRGKLVRVLRHELVHAFVSSVGGDDVPGWLNEGLAQRFEWTDPKIRQSLLDRAKERLEGHDLLPLEQLQRSLASLKDPDQIRRAYAQSLWVVAEIQTQYGERVVFEMVRGLGRGEGTGESFRRLTGGDLPTFLRHLRD